MAIINYKPTTNARRNMSTTDFSALSKTGPEKSLLAPKNKAAGRNSYGRITVRHRGGGNRKKYRVIDFKRQKNDMAATVLTLEYDPNRSAFIALVQYEDGEKRYIIAPNGLKAAIRCSPVRMQILSPATHCRSQISPPVPLSTTLSFIPARAHSLPVQPASWLS